MNCNYQGAITETKIVLECLKHEIDISIPYGNKSRYDLIMDINNKLYRIQIKTSRQAKTKGEAFIFNCYSVVNKTKHRYTKNEIDYFATIWNDNLYLIPVEECSSEKTLWIDEPKLANCCKANQYLFEEVIKTL